MSGCVGLPDRWSATAGKGDGDLETLKVPGDRDFDSTYLELGVSGPLGRAKEPRNAPMPPITIQAPAAPVAQPEPSGGIPWTELGLIAAGAMAGEGGRRGYNRVKSKKARPAG